MKSGTVLVGINLLLKLIYLNLLIFNLGVDKYDAPLAFTIDWISEFAKHCDVVVVLTMRQGDFKLPDNVKVYDIGHQKGYSKIRMGINFYARLFYILHKYKINGCFSHMNQLFSAMGGFILKLKRIKLVTWYAHASITKSLKIAHYFSTHMVASVYEAYPYKKDKLVVIGQGIDTLVFRRLGYNGEKTTILYSGRISKVKDLETLIKAFKTVNEKFKHLKLLIVGDAKGKVDLEYKKFLLNLVLKFKLESNVEFIASKERSLLPEINNNALMYINLTAPGSGDKVAWEAMACETPTIVANSGMIDTLGKYTKMCLFEYNDDRDLADKMFNIIEMTPEERAEMGSYLRCNVIKFHSLENLPQKVLSLL